MIAFRIGSPAYPLLAGAGAAASDHARWNSRGRHVIYASEHYATAVLEKVAQLNSPRLPRTLVYVRIDLPRTASIEELLPADLAGWDADSRKGSQRFGDRWYDDGRSLILLVPSLAAPGVERNVLIRSVPSGVCVGDRVDPRTDPVLSAAAGRLILAAEAACRETPV